MTLRDPTFDLPTVHKVLAVGGYPYMQPNTRPQPRRTQDQGMTYRVSFSTAPMHPIEEAHTHISRNASEFSRKPRESSVPHTNAHLFPPWHQPHPTAFGEFRIAEKANPHSHTTNKHRNPRQPAKPSPANIVPPVLPPSLQRRRQRLALSDRASATANTIHTLCRGAD